MKQKIAKGVVISSVILTGLSLMFFVGLMIFNIRRVFMIQDKSVVSLIISTILVLVALALVLSVVIYSFMAFIGKKEVDHTQYVNILYLIIIYNMIVYVFFSMVDFRLPTDVTGHLGGIHYLSYVFVYRTDLLPVSVFPEATIGFVHSFMGTDIVTIGAVILGFALSGKFKYAPVIGAVFGVVFSFVLISIINIYVVNNLGVELLYYKVDAVFSTLLIEFSLLGYVIWYIFLKK